MLDPLSMQQPPRAVVAFASDEDEIYIGFKKGDYARPEGVKGRFIKADAKKYPSREGWLTGGWAGGEAGLTKYKEQLKVNAGNMHAANMHAYSLTCGLPNAPTPHLPSTFGCPTFGCAGRDGVVSTC